MSRNGIVPESQVCYTYHMQSEGPSLYALCVYGVPPAMSVELLSRYPNEDEIPLNEFDISEYQVAEEL